MSQAKVDQYKKEKANRKETIAKEKKKRMISCVCWSVAGVVLLAWIGVSSVHFVKENRPVETIYADTTELDAYLNSLYEE